MKLFGKDYINNPQQLITDLNKGVMQAFHFIFKEYYKGLRMFANKILQNNHLSDDIVQDTFVKFWERKENFDSRAAIKVFLFLTVKNSCIDLKRRNQLENIFIEQNTEINADDEFYLENIEQQTIEIETIRLVHQAIENLPARGREIFLLSVKGLKNNEIAEELNISVNSVKTQKYRAINAIREQIGNELIIILILFPEIFF